MSTLWTTAQWRQWTKNEDQRSRRHKAKAAKPETPPKYTRWTQEEWSVLQTYYESLPDHRPPYGYSASLRPLLPGRSDTDVRNAFNILRRKNQRLCQCGAPLQAAELRCPTCVTAQITTRNDRLARGSCGSCGSNLTEGSSTTLCPKCRTRRQKQRPKDVVRFEAANPQRRSKQDPLACKKILPWPSCGHTRWIAEIAALQQRPVIDLFGGTGEILRLIALLGGHAYAYYDADERIANLVAHAVKGTPLTQEAQDLLTPQGIKPYTKNERLRRIKLLGNTLRPTLQTVGCQDALLAIQGQPENALFICDPPWPGTKHPCLCYATIDHEALIEALLDLPEGQDYILSLGSERQALLLAASKGMPNLYWRTSGPYSAKSMIALSPRLAEQLPRQIGQPIDPKKFGL